MTGALLPGIQPIIFTLISQILSVEFFGVIFPLVSFSAVEVGAVYIRVY